MTERKERIIKVIHHRQAFRRVERQVFGYNTIKSITHDLDKLLMLIFLPISVSKIRALHKEHAKHHKMKPSKMPPSIVLEKMIDWECARYTKTKSSHTARQHLEQKYRGKKVFYTRMKNYLDLYGIK